mmetsp:Transcript_13437/g.32860  ORF Transcript_13437/g.32860 Transcript_13437/m.32860 type:complete len:314 (-) Transcript_13437:563-1504(-)
MIASQRTTKPSGRKPCLPCQAPHDCISCSLSRLRRRLCLLLGLGGGGWCRALRAVAAATCGSRLLGRLQRLELGPVGVQDGVRGHVVDQHDARLLHQRLADRGVPEAQPVQHRLSVRHAPAVSFQVELGALELVHAQRLEALLDERRLGQPLEHARHVGGVDVVAAKHDPHQHDRGAQCDGRLRGGRHAAHRQAQRGRRERLERDDAQEAQEAARVGVEPRQRVHHAAEQQREDRADGQLRQQLGCQVGRGGVGVLGALAVDDGALAREHVERLDQAGHGGVDGGNLHEAHAVLDGRLRAPHAVEDGAKDERA